MIRVHLSHDFNSAPYVDIEGDGWCDASTIGGAEGGLLVQKGAEVIAEFASGTWRFAQQRPVLTGASE